MKKVTAKELRKWGVKEVFIPGLLLAATLGWTGWKQLENYRQSKNTLREFGVVREVRDGDTVVLDEGTTIRLIGINAPDRGYKGYEGAKGRLGELVNNKKVWLEFDRYQDDKYGRILAWIWINCESKPIFTPSDYMFLTYNQSKPGLMDNPEGCKKGNLVQEELIKSGNAEINVYKDRGKLKYIERLENRK